MEISCSDLGSEAMWAVPESIWKQRFISRLAQLFAQRGTDATSALADAEAHADVCYPQRGDIAPEREADAVYSSLYVDNVRTDTPTGINIYELR